MDTAGGSWGPEELTDDELDGLVDRADLDGLVRLIDARTATRDWAGLLRCRERSRAAVHTGRQLWPAATLAEYRLALWAPADWATRVLGEDAGRFTIGPLTEVVAQHHTWQELRPHLEPGPRAALCAHELVVRGVALDEADDPVLEASPNPLELPYALEPWEPRYPVAGYTDAGVDAPAPGLPSSDRLESVGLPIGSRLADDRRSEEAFRDLVAAWTASSNGRAELVAVEGDHRGALFAAGVPAEGLRVATLTPDEAVAWLAWAGASGGAHGRRRGAALGRFSAWALLAALGGLDDDWGMVGDEIGAVASELHWYWFETTEPPMGWRLQLAVEDPADGLAWVLSARDDAF